MFFEVCYEYVVSIRAWSKFDHNWNFMALAYLSHWKMICVFVKLLVDEFEIKVLGDISCHNLHVNLCECLSKADSFTSIEGTEALRVSLFAIRSQ